MPQYSNQRYKRETAIDAWQDLHDFGTKNGTWPMKISKSIARDHCTCQMITPLKRLIEQCQMLKTGMELQKHFLDLLTTDTNVANTFGCHASKQIEVFFRRGSDDTQRIKKQHQSCIRRRRSLAFIYTNIAASSPFVEVQLNLTPPQMAMFIKGLQYVIPCQSRFLHRTNEQIIQKQYEMLFNTVTNCLQDNCMSASNKHVQEAFSELKTTVHELHVKKLSGHLNIRARYEHALVKNIRRLIDKQPHVIVRRTDKSKVFYIGKTDDFLRKAAAYMTTTNAYEVFSDNKSPLHNSLTAVQTLLGALLQEKVIDKKLCSKLLPKMNNLE
ncbi:unnamed protein product, partial [Adineta ricciae]